MEITVLIEPVAGNGYRARGGGPFTATAEGATKEEALQRLRQVIQGQLSPGAELIALSLPDFVKLWLRLEGVYKDDPLFDAWQAAIADYRRQADEDPDTP